MGGGGGDIEVGEEGERLLYLSLRCHHQNDSCTKVGSDERHFDVSVGNEQNHKSVHKPQPF